MSAHTFNTQVAGWAPSKVQGAILGRPGTPLGLVLQPPGPGTTPIAIAVRRRGSLDLPRHHADAASVYTGRGGCLGGHVLSIAGDQRSEAADTEGLAAAEWARRRQVDSEGGSRCLGRMGRGGIRGSGGGSGGDPALPCEVAALRVCGPTTAGGQYVSRGL